jgi:hypothetical protein
VGLERQAIGGIGRHLRLNTASRGKFPDVAHELTLLVCNQPAIKHALND